ncbi:hypothetical protein ACT3TH_05775 [Psychrobacter sp. AOP22-C1-C5]|uniref:hypothetical protein n=1 Tax=Psychrobacter sp. AOP22-C1-C5 TaxID=3457716 RepID=UPI004036C019
MQNLQFSWTTVGLTASLVLGMSACQPQATESSISNEADTTEQIAQKPAIEAPLKSVTASASAIDAKTCLALNDAMQKVNNESNIEAIYAVQQTLKNCLPTASNAEVIALLKSYQAMYRRFLASDLDSEADYETFNSAIYELYYGEGLSSAQLKTLTPHDQYLVSLVKSDADISIYDEGEGYFSFTHDLQAMVDIFAPYLRPDQRDFVQRMATDNQESFWSDASVTVTFEALVDRAMFWEDYIKRYPNGYAVADAKSLLDFYRYIIFFGSDNTQWTDDAIREFIEPQDRQMIVQLVRRPNSLLAKDAQNFLKFLTLSDNERQEKYPIPRTPDNDSTYEINEGAAAHYQLDEAMQIPSIWDDYQNSRDCMNGIFCQDPDSE